MEPCADQIVAGSCESTGCRSSVDRISETQSLREVVVTRTQIAASCAVFFFLVLVLHAPRVAAQGLFGTISGVVTDPSGAVVPGATVKVTNIDTNVTVALKTNGAGVYNATSLNPGMYKVEAEAKGFKTAVANKIPL